MSEPLDLPGITDVPHFDRTSLDALLCWAVEQEASDLAIKTGSAPSVRLHGHWQRVGRRILNPEEITGLLTSIHQAAAMATLQGGVPLDFRYVVKPERGVRYGFRVSATATAVQAADIGVEIVLRTIPSQPPTADDLALEQAIRDASSPKYGCVLVIGPTGSGKSTTLAAIIRGRLETAAEHIITYEAPIEFDFEAIPNPVGIVSQSEVPTHLPDFSSAVANALRRAPDVILIGEARDKATIAGCVRAAITGHAVYSTTHANSVPMTIPRMADEFPSEERWPMAIKIIDAMRMIIHQRLVRRPDGKRTALREYLVFGEDERRLLIDAGESRFTRVCADLVHERGQSLVQDAAAKHAEGLIADSEYSVLKAELALREAA